MAPRQDQRQLALVVEDDLAYRRAIARELGRTFDVVAVSSMAEAFGVLGHCREIDVLVTDYELWDGRSGVQVLEQARRVKPDAVRVLVSAKLDRRLEQWLNHTGLTHACMRKPLMPEALSAVLEQLMPRNSTAAQLARGTEREGEEPKAWPVMRRQPRIPCQLSLDARFPGWESFRMGVVVNLSKGGLMCVLDQRVETDQVMEVVVHIPGRHRLYLPCRPRHVGKYTGHDPTLDAVWAALHADDELFRVGVEFEALDEPQQQLLNDALVTLSEEAGSSLS